MQLIDWLKTHDELFAALGILSLALFLISLVVFPLIIIFLPHDYFLRAEPEFMKLNPFGMMLRILKNAFGVLLIVGGLLMLFLPGQGLLSLFLGVSLVHFPGKRRLELRLLGYQKTRSSVAWVRRKAKRPPIRLPQTPDP